MPMQIIQFDNSTPSPSCGDELPVNCQNSDANCHRKRVSYARTLVKKNPDLCNTCIYNDNNNGEN